MYSIANYAEGCLRRLEQPDGIDVAELREVTSEISAQTHRAGEIIRRLRRMVQRQETQRVPVDVNKRIQEACRLLQPELHRNVVDLNLDLEKVLPPVIGDDIQLEQVVVNLVRNAMDAIDHKVSGSRRITVATKCVDEEFVEVSVADTGAGIARTELDEIFDAFYTTTDAGMGMGLAISRTIVEAHDGRIWAENSEGGGAIFRFHLPVYRGDIHDR